MKGVVRLIAQGFLGLILWGTVFVAAYYAYPH